MVHIAPSWCTSSPYTVVVVYNVPWVHPDRQTDRYYQVHYLLASRSHEWIIILYFRNERHSTETDHELYNTESIVLPTKPESERQRELPCPPINPPETVTPTKPETEPQLELPAPPISSPEPVTRQSVAPSVTHEDMYMYINEGAVQEQVPSAGNVGCKDSYTGLRSGYIEPAARQSVTASQYILSSVGSDAEYGYIDEEGKKPQVPTGGDIVGITDKLPPGGNDGSTQKQQTSGGNDRNNETGKEGNDVMYLNEGQTEGGYING